MLVSRLFFIVLYGIVIMPANSVMVPQRNVESLEELIRALADRTVQSIIITADITSYQPGLWDPYDLIHVDRDILVKGYGPVRSLDLHDVTRKVRMEPQTRLKIENLELRGVIDSASHGMFILDNSTDVTIKIKSCRKHQVACQGLYEEKMASERTQRPPGFPGTQYFFVGDGEFTSSRSGQTRVFPQYGVYKDVALSVVEDDGCEFIVHYMDTVLLCDQFTNNKCVEDHGLRGCLQWLEGVSPRVHQDPPHRAGGRPAWQIKAAIAVPSIAGGLLLAGFVWWTRRRFCLSTHPTSSGSEAPLSAPTSGVFCPPGIKLGSLIGTGAYGRVYEGEWKGKPVAVKIIVSRGAEMLDRVTTETRLSMTLSHPNVVRSLFFTTRPVMSGQDKPALTTSLGYMWQQASSNSGGASSLHHSGNISAGKYSFQGKDVSDTTGDTGHSGSSGQQAGSPAFPVFELNSAAFQTVSKKDSCHPCWDQMDMETWIVQELCPLGSLSLAIRNQLFVGTSEAAVNMWFVLLRALDVARGMSYLHSLHVCHGDLKPDNILLVHDPRDPMGCRAKVADFGISRALTEGKSHLSTQTLGTVTHMSPELLVKGRLGQEADVYSFGIMMWELVSGRCAYHGMGLGEVVQKVVVQQCRPSFPEAIPLDYIALAEACWNNEPKQRPLFPGVVEQLQQLLNRMSEEGAN